jgi:predicted nucleic acid-binding protein
MKRLVADTGPLLHLHEAGALHLIPLIGETLIAPLVLSELHIHAPGLWPGELPHWAGVKDLSVPDQQRATEWQSAGLLHGGEAQALALALEHKPDWFLTDDAGARLMAESFGIETRGSIGIILWAAATRLVARTEAESLLTALEKSSLWMSPRVRAQARAALTRLFEAD